MDRETKSFNDRHSSIKEDISYIKKIMDDAKALVVDSSFFFTLFGSLVVFGTIVSYILAALGHGRIIWLFWVILMCPGAAAAVLRSYNRRQKARAMASRVLSAAWISAIVLTVSASLSVALTSSLTLSAVLGITSAAIALGYTVTASVSGSRAIFLLSIPWWIGGPGISLAGDFWAPAVLGGLTFCFELIPGIIMSWRKRSA